MARNPFGIRESDLRPKINFGFGVGEKSEKRIPKKILRRMVWKRDKGRCQLCRIKIRAGEDWDLARRRAGGPYTYGNCFVAHHTCNISQGKATPSQVRATLGTKPKRGKKKTRGGHRRKGRGLFGEIVVPDWRSL